MPIPHKATILPPSEPLDNSSNNSSKASPLLPTSLPATPPATSQGSSRAPASLIPPPPPPQTPAEAADTTTTPSPPPSATSPIPHSLHHELRQDESEMFENPVVGIKMTRVTSAEKLEPVSSTQEAPIHLFGAKAPHKTFVRQSKFALAENLLAENEVRGQASTKLVGKPNQTCEEKYNPATGCSNTSQKPTTVTRSNTSIVREAIRKFSEKCEILPDALPLQPRIVKEDPKIETAPKKSMGPKSDKMRGEPSKKTPNYPNILPPKLAWKPKSMEENRKNETSNQDHPKNTLGQKCDRMGGNPSSQILKTKTTPTPQKKVISPPPESAPTEETSKNLKGGRKPAPELNNFEAPPPSPKKNAFQVLKWPPKSQNTPKNSSKTKPAKPRTKPKPKQPEQPEEKNNQTKITSILKLKTSKNSEPETSEAMQLEVEGKPLKITLKPPILVHNKNQETSVKLIVEPETKQEQNQPLRPKLEIETKARPEKKTNSCKKPGQPRKTKPKVVEVTNIELFLAKKKRERENKIKGTTVFENPTPSMLPSKTSASATLSPRITSLTQSAPRADRQESRDNSESSTSLQQGDCHSSANKGEYQL